MKAWHFILIPFLLLVGEARAQFLGPPCVNPPSCTQYPPIAGDTTPLASKLIVQVPPFASNNLRSITGTELAVWVGAGCDSTCAQALLDSLQARLGDSISVPYLHATDSLQTPILSIGGAQIVLSDSPDFVTFIGNMIFNGGIGFFGKFPTVFVPCPLPYAAPPNPVTQAQARAEYDLALQNCLDENGVNLVNTP